MKIYWWGWPSSHAPKRFLATSVTFLLMMFALFIGSAVANAQVNTFEDAAERFSQRQFAPKQEAVNWLVSNQHPFARDILSGLMDGRLYYQPSTRQLYLIESLSRGATAMEFPSLTPTEIVQTRDFRKVRVNNALRVTIRQGIAQLDLTSTSETRRLAAAKSLLGETSPTVLMLVEQAYQTETSEPVKDILALVLAIANIQSGEANLRQSAITVLSDSLEPAAYQALLKARETELQKAVEDQTALPTLNRAIDAYQQSQRVYEMVETLFFGLSLGSVLVLAGIGLAITFGVMGVINMAHGELIMIGAYTTYVIQQLLPDHIGLSLWLAIPAAFVVSGTVGIAIERGVIRFLYGRPLETLLATFGISLVLQQAVRSVFSPLNRSVSTPDWMSGMLEINPLLALTYNRLYIILFCLMVFGALVVLLKKTPLGLQVRAVSQNRAMARAMGVRSEWVDAMTFGLGSGVAGIAGVALSQLSNVGPNMGQSYIIDSFMVVVFGGVGNLWGTLVAGLSLGIFNKVLEPWAGAVLAKILVLIFIILFIQKRPRGLFPQRGRAVEG